MGIENSFFNSLQSNAEENSFETAKALSGKGYINESLERLKEYDEATYRHHLNVAYLAQRIGGEIGLTNEETLILTEAALVHDLGKLQVDREILHKKEKLTEEDWEKIGNHTSREFFEFIRNVGGLDVAKVAIAHHDFGSSRNNTRPNGERREESGFDTDNALKYRKFADRRKPDPQAIGLANILNIIDEFESLRSSERPYKKALSLEECVEILKNEFPGDEEEKVIKALITVSV